MRYGQAAVFLALILSACGIARPAQPPGPVVLTVNDIGRTVSIRVGQGFFVRLASNPTTGYRWFLVGFDAAAVETRGDAAFVPDAAPDGAAGVGGVDVWPFRGARVGSQTLSFEYRRPWEGSAPAAQTATFSVMVR